MKSIFLLGFLLVASFGAARLRNNPQSAWRVGLRSYGPVAYGMSLAEASSALREPLEGDTTDPDACDYVFPKLVPKGVKFMVVGGRLERVDVDSVGVETISGVHVGSTEAEVNDKYPGQIQTKPHPYTEPEGHYLVYRPRDPADTIFALIFETDGKVVTRFRAGRRPPVEYIEGCS